VKAGVIDPTKVTRTALQNAASIAGPAADHRSPDCRDSGAQGCSGGGGHGGGMDGMYYNSWDTSNAKDFKNCKMTSSGKINFNLLCRRYSTVIVQR
jgi:hypothetical protein